MASRIAEDFGNASERPDFAPKSKRAAKISGDYQEVETYGTEVEINETETVMEDGKPQFVLYVIDTETNAPEFDEKKYTVKRRYNDFVWLRDRLVALLEATKLPKGMKRVSPVADLPAASFFSSWFGPGRFDEEFVEERRVGLVDFLNKVADHTICKKMKPLLLFLSVEDFADVEKQCE
eukprot:TRINITY_DN4262_c0_g1_i2.p1 TRINITY_DN4262_c0_g1~~TRINITY_DN4262_c0_g1_i2.p1  ORF type:complete len:179 (+),score=43.26 TRINITY_DN4262_c0_g1_i2:301-837(+)